VLPGTEPLLCRTQRFPGGRNDYFGRRSRYFFLRSLYFHLRNHYFGLRNQYFHLRNDSPAFAVFTFIFATITSGFGTATFTFATIPRPSQPLLTLDNGLSRKYRLPTGSRGILKNLEVGGTFLCFCKIQAETTRGNATLGSIHQFPGRIRDCCLRLYPAEETDERSFESRCMLLFVACDIEDPFLILKGSTFYPCCLCLTLQRQCFYGLWTQRGTAS